ncbi:hypothetical protein EVAR_3749_1 [Eumeta japonica]|uniref:Uncharacterized protein n=1 Tax=Eumeta variegata TaxID=151549 RepID=A0A4C1SSB9_EUMVA|nr:hypothetical protein EVAR_3749_1 [Eumeta japonica]
MDAQLVIYFTLVTYCWAETIESQEMALAYDSTSNRDSGILIPRLVWGTSVLTPDPGPRPTPSVPNHQRLYETCQLDPLACEEL